MTKKTADKKKQNSIKKTYKKMARKKHKNAEPNKDKKI